MGQDTKQTDQDEDNTFAKEALLCEIGVKLEKTRETKGLSKEQVLKELKFNVSFLDALEGGRWDEMPGEVYALGFLRQYAALLNLDLGADIERIKTNSYELTTPLTYPDAPISPNKTWAIIAALLFILIIIISNLFSSADKTVPQPVVAPHTSEKESTVTNKSKVIVTHSPESMDKTNIAVEEKKVAKSLFIHQETDEINKPDKHLKAFTFIAVSDDVWLQIYEDIAGQEPQLKREALLRIGQSFSLESNHSLLLTSGKPTALKVVENGQTLYEAGELGEKNKVLKLFQLNPS